MEISFNNKDSQAIKAISIIVIVLHNFLHFTNKIGENEHRLDPERIYSLIAHIQGQPIGFLNYVFSYFGWYFIVPFIFISGYGLTKKRMRKQDGLVEIAISAVLKVAVLLLVGTLYIWATGYKSSQSPLVIFYHKLATIDNFRTDRVFAGVGPWWYFSLAIQLYLIFPLIYMAVTWRRAGVIILFILSYLFIYVLYFYMPKLNTFGTAIGHIPTLALGVYLAHYKNQFGRGSILALAAVSFAVFLLSQRYPAFFPVTYLSFLIVFLVFYVGVRKWFDNVIVDVVGKVSAFVFILNGPIRNQTMDHVKGTSDMYPNLYELFVFGMSLMHLLAVVIVSVLFYVCLDGVMRKMNSEFSLVLSGSVK